MEFEFFVFEVDWIEVAETGSSLLCQCGWSLGFLSSVLEEFVKLSCPGSELAEQLLTREAYTK
jgi:hypothetical protein